MAKKSAATKKPAGEEIVLEKLRKVQRWVMKIPSTIDRPAHGAYRLGFISRTQDWLMGREENSAFQAKALYRERARQAAYVIGYNAAKDQELA